MDLPVGQVFEQFTLTRCPDAHAICDLSYYNYLEVFIVTSNANRYYLCQCHAELIMDTFNVITTWKWFFWRRTNVIPLLFPSEVRRYLRENQGYLNPALQDRFDSNYENYSHFVVSDARFTQHSGFLCQNIFNQASQPYDASHVYPFVSHGGILTHSLSQSRSTMEVARKGTSINHFTV